MHAGALLKADIPGLLDVRCYELRPWQGPRPVGFNWSDEDFLRAQQGKFAVLYESRVDDPTELDTAIRKTRPAPGCVEWTHRGRYRLQVALHPAGFDSIAHHETNGILIAMVHPRDEARYEEWYVPTHLDDEILHGINHSVTRFLNIEYPPARPKSLTVLETDWKDISEARGRISAEYLPHWRWPPGIHSCFEIVAASDYQRFF
jgi:hypothetical protein